MLGSGQDAVDHCRRALDLNREVGNLVGEAHAWDHLGYAMHLVGDDAEAIACCRRALKLLREVRDGAEQVGVLARLGDIYSSVGTRPWPWPCGGGPWRYWKSCTTSAPMRSGPGWASRLGRGAQRVLSFLPSLAILAIMKWGRRGTNP
jgi:tetratricopeptide (TPR) repeat protein